MKVKIFFIITAILFFPITILFSPLIVLLFDIRHKLQISNSLSEQQLNLLWQLSGSKNDDHTTELVSLFNDYLTSEIASKNKA